MVEVVAVSPGAISALVFVLEAEDQSELQGAPENSAANGPLRKLCICDAVMLAAAGSLGSDAEGGLERLIDRGLGGRSRASR